MEKNDDLDLKIILWLILFILFGIIIVFCKPESHDSVMTVNGPESPDSMGLTLEHEHVLVDFIGADSTGYFRWNRDSVIEKMLPLIEEARDKGVKTIIECTPAWLGRDPLLLKNLSQKTGITFITNTGYYGARKNKFLPQSFYSEDAKTIAERWIAEYKNGIEGTGIKPGFIKIAVDPDDSLSPEHKRLVIAAALTHLKTGLTIASHTGVDNPAFAQLKILKDYGVSPEAFIWVHAMRGTLEGNISAAKSGAWISLDNIHPDIKSDPSSDSIGWYVNRIIELRKNGLLNKILLSHDSGWYDPAQKDGGNPKGYTAIFDCLIPALRSKGMTDKDINQMLVENPGEAFKIRIRLL
jgi:phosphotriesterase-related protein